MFALGYIMVMHFTYILISLVFYINYISICWKWAGIEEKNRNLFSFMLFVMICLMLDTSFHSHFSKMQVIQFCSFLETDSTICFPLITLDSLGIHINQCICTTNMTGKSVQTLFRKSFCYILTGKNIYQINGYYRKLKLHSIFLPHNYGWIFDYQL